YFGPRRRPPPRSAAALRAGPARPCRRRAGHPQPVLRGRPLLLQRGPDDRNGGDAIPRTAGAVLLELRRRARRAARARLCLLAAPSLTAGRAGDRRAALPARVPGSAGGVCAARRAAAAARLHG